MKDVQKVAANKAVVREFLLSLSQLRLDEARELMHKQCECQLMTVSIKPNVFDREGMLHFLESVKSALPGAIRFEFVEMTTEGNRVSTVVNGFSKTIEGTDYNNRYHFLHYLEDGKIRKHLEFMDSYLGAKVIGPILQRLLRKA